MKVQLKFHLPFINISKNNEQQKSNNPVILKLDNMDSISTSINQLRKLESEPLKDITENLKNIDAHQWISYIILTGIIIFLIMY